MKATIKMLQGNTVDVNLDIGSTPTIVMKDLYRSNPAVAEAIFANQRAIDQLLDGRVDAVRSGFFLSDPNGNTMSCGWLTPFDQTDAKTVLAECEADGEPPVFTVLVSPLVG